MLGFGSSSALAAAYGIAVTRHGDHDASWSTSWRGRSWGWTPAWPASLALVFSIIDLAFFGANVLKILDGGWVPLVIGGWWSSR